MQRETLRTIAERLQCVRDGDLYRVHDERRLTVYLGQPGRGVAIDHVLSLLLSEAHLEIEARDRGTFYVAYDAIHAVLDGARKEGRGTGGGSVGF